ncbi:hypothetical protein EDD15DRAFT_2246369 [Pisolithus albus]|nr:hypothetical protein EDD15DRAFT_2246369 [Pisolithus albus]
MAMISVVRPLAIICALAEISGNDAFTPERLTSYIGANQRRRFHEGSGGEVSIGFLVRRIPISKFKLQEHQFARSDERTQACCCPPYLCLYVHRNRAPTMKSFR